MSASGFAGRTLAAAALLLAIVWAAGPVCARVSHKKTATAQSGSRHSSKTAHSSTRSGSHQTGHTGRSTRRLSSGSGKSAASRSQAKTHRAAASAPVKGAHHPRGTQTAHQRTNKVPLERESRAIKPNAKETQENQDYPPDTICRPYEEETSKLTRAYELHDQGLNDLNRGDLGLAVKHLREATQVSGDYYIHSSPTEALLYYDLGVAAEAAEQQNVAREAYFQALERNPNLFEARIKLATVLAREGKHAEAIESARRAIEMEPLDSRGHLLLGLLLERQGKSAEGKAEKAKSKKLLDTRPSSGSEPGSATSAAEAPEQPVDEPPEEMP